MIAPSFRGNTQNRDDRHLLGKVEGRVMLRRLNLEGDGQADPWGHGGAFRAVYAYSHENYDYWARELGRDDFAIGQFGENFTVEGMLDP